ACPSVSLKLCTNGSSASITPFVFRSIKRSTNTISPFVKPPIWSVRLPEYRFEIEAGVTEREAADEAMGRPRRMSAAKTNVRWFLYKVFIDRCSDARSVQACRIQLHKMHRPLRQWTPNNVQKQHARCQL